MSGAATALRGICIAAVCLDLLLVLVVVAIDAQQFPVAAISRVVVVVVIAMMNGQFAQVGLGEFSGTAPADPRADLEGTRAIGVSPGIGCFSGIQNDFVEAAVIDGFNGGASF